jgi:3-hydroxybutyryl-CoA dehydrogenase
MFDIKKITVLGAGAMGNGIAQVSAQAGYQVIMQDITEEALQKGMGTIRKSLDRMASKGKIAPEKVDETLSRIKTTVDLEEAAKDADLVIEAVPEILDLKIEIYKRLDAVCKPEAIFGSNTSTLPITVLGAATKRPQQVCGIHFMNPVPVMPGVELIKGRLTSDEVMEVAVNYVKNIGREACLAVDYAGFIVSRLLDVVQNEACKLVMEGNAPEEIDKAMKLCANWPIGPCALMDLVGLDIVEHGLGTLENDLGPEYKAAPLLRQMVRAGELGRKTGRGFYEYNK